MTINSYEFYNVHNIYKSQTLLIINKYGEEYLKSINQIYQIIYILSSIFKKISFYVLYLR